MAEPVVRLTTTGAGVFSSAVRLDGLRDDFERRHVVRLPQLIDPSVLARVQRLVNDGAFTNRVHARIGVELSLSEGPAVDLLFFLTNDPTLFAVIHSITGCGPIGCFMGRIYRMVPGRGHHDSWHTDAVEDRLIGLSVNLGAHPYRGGVFQIRQRGVEGLLCETPNTAPGDGILFRIAPFLEHRITPMEGDVAKTAYAGWFKSRPDFLSLLGSDESESHLGAPLTTRHG